MLAVAVAPSFGFWVYQHGWGWLCAEAALLNLGMAAIAFSPRGPTSVAARRGPPDVLHAGPRRVAGGGGDASRSSSARSATAAVTSFVAVYAERNGISPKGIFFTTFAIVVLVTRLVSGRIADRIGHRRFLLPCLALVPVALVLLALARTRVLLVAAAIVFGIGFGNMYPAFVAHVVKFVERPAAGGRLRRDPRRLRHRHRHRLDQPPASSRSASASRPPSARPPSCRRSRSRTSCGRRSASCSAGRCRNRCNWVRHLKEAESPSRRLREPTWRSAQPRRPYPRRYNPGSNWARRF